MKKKTKKVNTRSKKEFEKYLERVENPNYPWVAKDLPENASSLERAKYELCEKILAYQEDTDLSDKEIAHQIGLSKEKTLQILFHWIEKFSLDELINYTNKLFAPAQIQVIIRQTRPRNQKVIYA